MQILCGNWVNEMKDLIDQSLLTRIGRKKHSLSASTTELLVGPGFSVRVRI